MGVFIMELALSYNVQIIPRKQTGQSFLRCLLMFSSTNICEDYGSITIGWDRSLLAPQLNNFDNTRKYGWHVQTSES